nr:hypothetical protein [Nocardia ninae]
MPSEPISGISGSTPAATIDSIRSTTSGRTPIAALAIELARSTSASRTTPGGSMGPTPAACERSMRRWNSRC